MHWTASMQLPPVCPVQVLLKFQVVEVVLPALMHQVVEAGDLGAVSRRGDALTVIPTDGEGRASIRRVIAATSLSGPARAPRSTRRSIIITPMGCRVSLVTLAIGSSEWPAA